MINVEQCLSWELLQDFIKTLARSQVINIETDITTTWKQYKVWYWK